MRARGVRRSTDAGAGTAPVASVGAAGVPVAAEGSAVRSGEPAPRCVGVAAGPLRGWGVGFTN